MSTMDGLSEKSDISKAEGGYKKSDSGGQMVQKPKGESVSRGGKKITIK